MSAAPARRFFGADDVHQRVDLRQVGERLGEVPPVAAGARVDLFGVEAERARVGQHPLAQLACSIELADLHQRRDQPERTDRERALLALETVVGLLGAIAQHQPVVGELVGDREHGGHDPRVVGRQEPEQGRQQQRGVQRRRSVGLGEYAALVDALVQDVGLDAVGLGLPAHGHVGLVHDLGEPGPPVARHPAHDLRGGEVLRFASDLPDPLVGFGPPGDRAVDLLGEPLPGAARQELPAAQVEEHRVEQRAPDVVLGLAVRGVADAHGLGELVAREVVQDHLGEVGLSAHRVHHLQRRPVGDLIGDEVEEAVRFEVEAQGVEAPERERGVAHPAVAVVPVPLPARRLGQRGGGGGDQRAGGGVGEAFQRQGRPLQMRAPRVVGELALVEPAAPEVGGLVDLLPRFLGVCRRWVRLAVPRQRGERGLAVVQSGERDGGTPRHAQAHVRGETQGGIVGTSVGHRLLVALARVLPARVGTPVVEHRLAVQDQLDLSLDAADRAHQHVPRFEVAGRTAVLLATAVGVDPWAHHQRVAHDEPTRPCLPGGLQDIGAGKVATTGRHEQLGRPEPERAGSPVEDGAEHAGAVGAWEAKPLDAPAGPDQRRDLAVGQEPVFADRGEGTLPRLPGGDVTAHRRGRRVPGEGHDLAAHGERV